MTLYLDYVSTPFFFLRGTHAFDRSISAYTTPPLLTCK